MEDGVIMTNKIMFERILAGGILKFGKLDSADISLIVKDIDKVFEVDIDMEIMDKYVVTSNGDILLCDEYMNKMYKNINCRGLEKLSVGMIDRYFNNMDVMNFVLRKVKFLGEGNVPRDDLIHNFSVIQLHELKNLYREGYVEDYVHEDCIYGDYHAVRVSKLGMVKLFINGNCYKYLNFYREILKKNGDIEFICDYLMNFNLNEDINSILDVDKYLEYVGNTERNLDSYLNSLGYISYGEYDRKLVKGE